MRATIRATTTSLLTVVLFCLVLLILQRERNDGFQSSAFYRNVGLVLLLECLTAEDPLSSFWFESSCQYHTNQRCSICPHEEARFALRKSIQLSDHSDGASIGLALLSMSQGDWASAERAILRGKSEQSSTTSNRQEFVRARILECEQDWYSAAKSYESSGFAHTTFDNRQRYARAIGSERFGRLARRWSGFWLKAGRSAVDRSDYSAGSSYLNYSLGWAEWANSPVYAGKAYSSLGDLKAFEADWNNALTAYKYALSFLPSDEAKSVLYPKYYSALVGYYHEVYESDPSDVTAEWFLAKYLVRLGRWEEAFPYLTRLTTPGHKLHLNRREVGAIYYDLGRWYVRHSQLDWAAINFEKAIEHDSKLVEANIWLQNWYEAHGERDRLSNLRTSLSRLRPEHKLDRPPIFTQKGFQFIGFDLNKQDLEMNVEIQATLYWASPVAAEQLSNLKGWYQAGDIWIQTTLLHNLLPAPGLECIVKDTNCRIYGYWIQRGDERFLQTVPVLNESTLPHRRVIGLENRPLDGILTVASTRDIFTNPGHFYLLAGELSGTNGASAVFSCIWFNNDSSISYNSVSEVTDAPWSLRARIVHIPEDVDKVRMWLFNRGGGGLARFDHLLFTSVETPDVARQN